MSRTIHLLDLIARDKLDKILNGFTEVTGVASIIADVRGRPITKPHNFTPFCQKYCRSTEEGRRRCYQSDRYGGIESLRRNEPPIYNCLNAGLMDCAAPVLVDGHHLATILCGQVLDEPLTEEVGSKRARSIGITDIDGYLEELSLVRLMSRKQLLSIANLMAVITQTISELALRKFLERKHSQQYLNRLINSVSDCIISTNMDGVISMINEAGADMFGYRTEELIGESILNLLSGEEIREIYKNKQDEIKKSKRLELTGVRGGKQSFPVQASISGIHSGSSKDLDYVTVIRDISEEKRIERMKEDLIGMVVHDIRNPVLSLQKALELLVGGSIGTLSKDQMEIMRLALDTSHKLFGMVSDLLDIYRNENGQFLLYKTLLDMNKVIESGIDQLKFLAEEKEVSFSLRLFPEPLELYGDQNRLSRTCINLLHNAVKYSPQKGTVEVSSKIIHKGSDELQDGVSRRSNIHDLIAARDCILVSVSDEGPGISEEYQETVFDKFFTIKSKNVETRKGLGLGLTFCKQVIESHGGHIWVESPLKDTGIGSTAKGCRFHFILPVDSGSR